MLHCCLLLAVLLHCCIFNCSADYSFYSFYSFTVLPIYRFTALLFFLFCGSGSGSGGDGHHGHRGHRGRRHCSCPCPCCSCCPCCLGFILVLSSFCPRFVLVLSSFCPCLSFLFLWLAHVLAPFQKMAADAIFNSNGAGTTSDSERAVQRSQKSKGLSSAGAISGENSRNISLGRNGFIVIATLLYIIYPFHSC